MTEIRYPEIAAALYDDILAMLAEHNAKAFDGPLVNHCMGVPYHVLSTQNYRGEFDLQEQPDSAEDAAERLRGLFRYDLETYRPNQVAVRRKPEVLERDGKFQATIRLAFFPQLRLASPRGD